MRALQHRVLKAAGFVLAALVTSAAAPAFAQERIFDFCLQTFANEAEIYDTAEAEGWIPLPDADARLESALVHGQGFNAMLQMPRAFPDAAAARQYVSSAGDWGRWTAEDPTVHFFQRGPDHLAIVTGSRDGVIDLRCQFSGRDLPDATMLLDEIDAETEGRAFRYRGYEPTVSANTIMVRVDVIGFEVPILALPAFTGRQSLILTHSFQVQP